MDLGAMADDMVRRVSQNGDGCMTTGFTSRDGGAAVPLLAVGEVGDYP
jgi:hypothetical protein